LNKLKKQKTIYILIIRHIRTSITNKGVSNPRNAKNFCLHSGWALVDPPAARRTYSRRTDEINIKQYYDGDKQKAFFKSDFQYQIFFCFHARVTWDVITVVFTTFLVTVFGKVLTFFKNNFHIKSSDYLQSYRLSCFGLPK
jgi:hypothetical protein